MKKRYIDFPKISLVGLICLLISLFVLIGSFPKSNEHYITFDRIIENVSIEEDAMHVKFLEDPLDYIFYEYDDVTFESLSDIKNGDFVKVTVAKNYKKFKYIIMYKMEKGNEIIYDSLQYYYKHDMAVVNVFAPTTAALILTYLLIFIFSIKVKEDESEAIDYNKFKINYNRHVVSAGIVFGVFGFVPFVCFLIQYLSKMIDSNLFGFGYVFLLFIPISILLIYCSVIEYFKLENGKYSYSKFSGKKFININEIDRVEICMLPLTSLCKIDFYDTNGKIAITFTDDGKVFSKGLFLNSMKKNNIKYEYKTVTEVVYK